MDLPTLLTTQAVWSLFMVRVFLGVIFFAHGAQKVFGLFGGPGLKGTIAYYQNALGVPPTLTVLAAVAKVHWRNGFFLNMSLQPGKGHGFEFNFALIGMALVLLVGGGGAKSMDRLILRWLM